MPLYNRGNLDPNASMASADYRTAAFRRQQADMAPARRQALGEISSEYGARGLGSGGQALQAAASGQNDFLQRLAEQRAGLGYQQADLQEGQRQALESRGWKLADDQAVAAYEDEMAKYDREDMEAMKRGKLISSIMNPLGKGAGAGVGKVWGGYKQDASDAEAINTRAMNTKPF